MKCLELTKEDPQPSFLDTYAWVLYKQALIEKDSKLKQEKLSLSKKQWMSVLILVVIQQLFLIIMEIYCFS